MRKILGFLLWVGGFLGAFACWGTYIGDNAGQIPVSYLAFMAILLLISGIGRRIFHIKKDLVESKGTVPAILSRINCMRFYCSIAWYAALAYASFCLKVVADEGEGILRFALSCLVCLITFFFVRRSCPSCGYKLTYDDAEYGDKAQWSVEGSSVVAKRDYTEYYHCPRCGRKLRFTKKRETARI